jgi:hypothetical protein
MSEPKLTRAEQRRQAANKAKNAAFNKLTDYQKRVTIARDVLAQLASNALGVAQGRYVQAEALASLLWSQKKEASELLQDASCTVCGVGSLFLCGVLRSDNYEIGRSDIRTGSASFNASLSRESTFGYLKQFFPTANLYAIEAAFELQNYAYNDFTSEARDFDPTAAITFGRVASATDPKTRLRLIMENIVVNAGTFRPEQLPQPRAVLVMETPNFEG